MRHSLPFLTTVAAFAVLLSARYASTQDLGCDLGPPEEAGAYDPAHPEVLVGYFLLTEVSTAWNTTVTHTSRFDLRLATPEERAGALQSGIGRFPREITHVGHYYRSDKSSGDLAEANGPIIYLGCRECLDASPTVMWVAAADDAALWGLWRNYQTGIAAVRDSAGNYAADPAGYFCASRTEPPGR